MLRAVLHPAHARPQHPGLIQLARDGVAAVLLDVEGTTTPISFVYDTLFPYARKHLRAYLVDRAASDETARLIDALRVERRREPIGSDAPEWVDVTKLASADSAADYAEWLMSRDSKSPALKALQGVIWKGGYDSGTLRGDVFADVPKAFQTWKAAGIRIAIYSSGSVLAQRLIFGTTQYGDLTRDIDVYFDTAVGPKRESDSYAAIARELGVAPQSILFLSDVSAELDAASSAGCRTALVARPGNPPQPSRPAMPTIKTLAEVTP